MDDLLPSLPAESRLCLESLVRVVAQPSSGPNKASTIRTLCSRQRHWLEFCAINKIPDPVLRHQSQHERNVVAASYTVYLSNGATIKDIPIKLTTIKAYLAALAKVSAKALLISPTVTEFGNLSPQVDKILKEHKRWESMPNRRDPITKSMILHWGGKSSTLHPDSFLSSFYDWMVIGAYAGFRKSEWLQDASEFRKNKNFNRNIDSTVKAFIRQDFEFRDAKNRRLYPDSTGHVKDAYQVSLC